MISMRPFLFRKLRNGARNRREMKRREPVLRSLPTRVYVEPTNLCQLKCALCPSGLRQVKPVGKMDMEVYRRVLEALGPTAQELHLYNWGEPFLHDGLPEMIEIGKSYGAEVIVSTNLNRLDEATARAIIAARLDRVNASIDGVTQAAYEHYRVGGDLRVVMDNLRMLCRLKAEAKSRRPRIEWQFLVTKRNESEIDDARRIAHELGVRFHTKRLRVETFDFGRRSGASMAQEAADWLPQDKSYNRYASKKAHPVCKSLWCRTVVNWSGAVSPCCQIFECEDHFALEWPDDFWALWNGPDYVAARRIFGPEGNHEARARKLICVPCAAAGNVV